MSLLRRKDVLLAILAIINAIVSQYLDVPVEVWASITGLLGAVILAIAIESVGAPNNLNINTLYRSRKILMAALGVVQTLVLAYLNVPEQIWLTVNGLLVLLINAIAVEDAREKAVLVKANLDVVKATLEPELESGHSYGQKVKRALKVDLKAHRRLP